MSALEPGLYRATVRGVPDVTVMVIGDGCGYMTEEINGCLAHLLKDITDARPLIVLDLSPFIGDAQLLVELRESHVWGLHEIAAQIEAQTKPARIPEPGLWGVVEAGLATYLPESGIRYKWVLHEHYWMSKSFSAPAEWSDLIDPTLIREGVTS